VLPQLPAARGPLPKEHTLLLGATSEKRGREGGREGGRERERERERERK